MSEILLLSVSLIAADASFAQTITDVLVDDGLLCYRVKMNGRCWISMAFVAETSILKIEPLQREFMSVLRAI
ncbi:hypothetical protein IFO70_15620 [Phormidium tenue FACHB-886]|nr:hypothetical protein [Phormidium tenue FACHB-886]